MFRVTSSKFKQIWGPYMNVKSLLFTIILVMATLLFGCSGDKAEPDTDQLSKQGESGIFPLTGVETTEDVSKRIVSVMVNNHPAARPQTGLSKADIVFEILAEGSITRFLALYQSEEPDVVGPVRSAREYYFDLADRYDALYVYHGAAGFVNDMIGNQGIESINGANYDNDGDVFKRESFRKAPHNSYFQFQSVYDLAEEKGYGTQIDYEVLPFTEDGETPEGDHAEHVEIIYPGRNASEAVAYTYDEQSEKYARYDANEQTVELNTDTPIQVDNVFIIEAYHEVIDSEGRRSINLQDGGKAYLIQKGSIQSLEWENVNGRIIPVKDGETIGFAQGKTWINVVPSDPGIEQIVNVQ